MFNIIYPTITSKLFENYVSIQVKTSRFWVFFQHVYKNKFPNTKKQKQNQGAIFSAKTLHFTNFIRECFFLLK